MRRYFLYVMWFSAFMHSAQAQEREPSLFFQMLNYVYSENPALNAERNNVKIADEKVSQANAGFRPSLNANAAAGKQREKVGNTDWMYGNDVNGSLVATQPLFSGFGTVEQKRAATMRVQAARARLLSVEQNILFTAIGDWLTMCEKEKVLILNRDNVERLRQYSQATQQRFDAGDGTMTDVAQAESRMAQAEARYAVALAERDSARATFERDTNLMAQDFEFPELPSRVPESAQAAQQAAADNPELAQAEYEERASGHDIGAAESSLWPNIYLRGSMAEERAPSLGLSRLRNDSITINASIPLYQGGGEYSRIREAKLAHEKNRYDKMDIFREVVERARIAWNNYASAGVVIDASQRASIAAERALGGVQEEQRQGLRSVTDVLDEQAELLGAQITEVQAQKTLRLEAYRLMASVGKLTGTELGLATDAFAPARYHDEVADRWAGTEVPR